MDSFVRAALDAEDPWDAYNSVVELRGALSDELDWLPHGGKVFMAWANLEDLYETGKTPIPDAHDAPRQAASEWLARPLGPNRAYIENWVASTGRAVKFFIERDGDFWRSPP